jgi:hypothetical protein
MEAKTNYTAVVQRDGDWWIGWLEEIPGSTPKGIPGKSCWRISDRLCTKLRR